MTKIIEQKEEVKQLHSLLNEQESVWVPVWKDHEKLKKHFDLSEEEWEFIDEYIGDWYERDFNK